MTRHARNCTAGAVYTYHEKKRDAAESGYGTQQQRIGKDSVKSFDCCSLTMQPCRNPVVTWINIPRIPLWSYIDSYFYNRKDGYLFDKEAILQYIISKKTEYARKLKEYERQRQIEDNEIAETDALEEHKKLMKFINTERNVVTSTATMNGESKKYVGYKYVKSPSADKHLSPYIY